MKIAEQAFTAVDWDSIEPTRHEGEQGFALWRTMNVGDMRIRRVDYSPGYVADHWCDRGHVLFVLEGELISELRDGRRSVIGSGHGYVVSDFGDAPHRSISPAGAKLFIVD